MRLAKGKLLGHRIKPHNGPWAGSTVFLPIGGTMVFRVGPFHGHYRANGEWVDLNGKP